MQSEWQNRPELEDTVLLTGFLKANNYQAACSGTGMNETATVTFTLTGTERIRDKGKLIGLANVEVEWGGIAFTLQGITVTRERDGSITCSAPRFRHPDGRWLPGVLLPPELVKAIGNEVLQAFK